MRKNTNKPYLSKTKKIVYIACSLTLLIFLITYINRERIFNATCEKEGYRAVLAQNLYYFTDENLRGNGFGMYIIVGKSITESELYDSFNSSKEATINAIENTYKLKDFHNLPLSEILKLNNNNIAYTLIFPGGDGGMYSIYPSKSFSEKKELISTEVYTFDVTNKKDFVDSKELIKDGRLKTYRLTYSVAPCNTLKYHSTEHDK